MAVFDIKGTGQEGMSTATRLKRYLHFNYYHIDAATFESKPFLGHVLNDFFSEINRFCKIIGIWGVLLGNLRLLGK